MPWITQFSLLFLIFANVKYSAAFIGRNASKGFRIQVNISPDSPISTAYNRPNATPEEKEKIISQRAAAQYQYINAKLDPAVSTDGLPVFHSKDGGYEYETTIGIGTPPVEATLIVDTGSGLLWLQCVPCPSCYKQTKPMFDPAFSKSYVDLNCAHPYCAASVIVGMSCDSFSDNCQYRLNYEEGSFTRGNIAFETLRLPNNDGPADILENVIFGCGHSNQGHLFNPRQNGILGMDMRPTSILQHKNDFTHSRFSFCMVPYFSPGGSTMLFGDKAILKGYRTPLNVTNLDDSYFVDLRSIFVDNEKLDLPLSTFSRNGRKGGTIVDTGTGLTHIPVQAYDLLAKKLMAKVRLPWFHEGELLCFNGKFEDLASPSFPTIKFQLDGLRIVWKPLYAFLSTGPGRFCLAVNRGTISNGVSILGSLLFQNVNVGIDIAAKKVFMRATTCDEQ